MVYSIYTGFAYNAQRKFKIAKIEYGNSIYFGGNLSIVLSPKITLDLEQSKDFKPNKKSMVSKFQNLGQSLQLAVVPLIVSIKIQPFQLMRV